MSLNASASAFVPAGTTAASVGVGTGPPADPGRAAAVSDAALAPAASISSDAAATVAPAAPAAETSTSAQATGTAGASDHSPTAPPTSSAAPVQQADSSRAQQPTAPVPARSYAHLTSTQAALAIGQLDAALASSSSRKPSSISSSSFGFIVASRAATGGSSGALGLGSQTGKAPTLKVAEVEDPVRVAAERAVLQERYQRVPPSVYQGLTTRTGLRGRRVRAGEDDEEGPDGAEGDGRQAKRRRVLLRGAGAAAVNSKARDDAHNGTGSSTAEKPLEQVYAPFSLPHLLARLATYKWGAYASYKRVKPPLAPMLLPRPSSSSSSSSVRMTNSWAREQRWRAWLEAQIAPVQAARYGWYVVDGALGGSSAAPAAAVPAGSSSGGAGAGSAAAHEAQYGGREVLRCGVCRKGWSVDRWIKGDASRAWLEREAAAGSATAEEEAETGAGESNVALDQHELWCAWRVRQSEAQLYSLAPESRPSLLSALIAQADEMLRILRASPTDSVASASQRQPPRRQPPLLSCVNPLSEEQHEALARSMEAEKQRQQRAQSAASGLVSQYAGASEAQEQDADWRTAAAIALCGWMLVPLSATPSAGADSSEPSQPQAPTTPQTAALQCGMCQRQVGLWTLLRPSQRAAGARTASGSVNGGPGLVKAAAAAIDAATTGGFNMLKEHRDFCAYVRPHAPAAARGRKTPSTSTKQLLLGWQMRLQLALGRRLDFAQRSSTTAGDVSADAITGAAEQVAAEGEQEGQEGLDGGNLRHLLDSVRAGGAHTSRASELLRKVRSVLLVE